MTRGLGSAESRDLVQYGFARFRDDFDASDRNDEGSIDEPLPLLASMNYFEQTSWSQDYIFSVGLSDPYLPGRGMTFEHYCAYLLALAFRSPICLSDVFMFADTVDKELGKQKAHLVMVKKAGNEPHFHPVDIFSHQGSTYLFGHTSDSTADTLSWLQRPHTAFCFPWKAVGPDLFLLLQLSDGTLLRISCQMKHYSKMSMAKAETKAAMRSTDPSYFCSEMREIQPPNESSETSSGKRTRKRFVMQSHVVYIFLPIDSQADCGLGKKSEPSRCLTWVGSSKSFGWRVGRAPCSHHISC